VNGKGADQQVRGEADWCCLETSSWWKRSKAKSADLQSKRRSWNILATAVATKEKPIRLSIETLI
jgi:hypothetical protein